MSAPDDLALKLMAMNTALEAVVARLNKAQAEIVSKQPHPQAITDFRIPPHMRSRLHRVIGRP